MTGPLGVDAAGSGSRSGPSGVLASRAELLERYGAYRRRQARGLLHMVPREAVRPLYRRALALPDGARRAGEAPSGEDEVFDPMEALLALCESLLPLPPFEVWLDDVCRSPEAHLLDVDRGAPAADSPVTVESRALSFADRAWAAHLRSFRDGDVWRGFIVFEDGRSEEVHRTALIFREADPARVRERFLSFEPVTLQAFLRSALP